MAISAHPDTPEFSRSVSLRRLNRAAPVQVDETATAAERKAVAELLGLISLPKLRIRGTLAAVEPGGWRFTGTVGATAVQACVVTLEPVKTRIDVNVERVYLPGAEEEAALIEVDAEAAEDVEPLPESLDFGLIAIEETALALPPYPRAPGAEAAEIVGNLDAEDEDTKPFAALEALKSRLSRETGED